MVDYFREHNSTVFDMVISIGGIENITESCMSIRSIFQVYEPKTLKLGRVDVIDVQTVSQGTITFPCFCKITPIKT